MAVCRALMISFALIWLAGSAIIQSEAQDLRKSPDSIRIAEISDDLVRLMSLALKESEDAPKENRLSSGIGRDSEIPGYVDLHLSHPTSLADLSSAMQSLGGRCMRKFYKDIGERIVCIKIFSYDRYSRDCFLYFILKENYVTFESGNIFSGKLSRGEIK